MPLFKEICIKIDQTVFSCFSCSASVILNLISARWWEVGTGFFARQTVERTQLPLSRVFADTSILNTQKKSISCPPPPQPLGLDSAAVGCHTRQPAHQQPMTSAWKEQRVTGSSAIALLALSLALSLSLARSLSATTDASSPSLPHPRVPSRLPPLLLSG